MTDTPNLRSVLDHYGVRYTDRAGDQKVLCPLHKERNPSASVNLDKGVFNCFTCDLGGSAYDLIMHKEGLSFVDAKRFLEGIPGAGDGSVRRERREGSLLPPRSGVDRGRQRSLPAWLRHRSGSRA